MESKMYRHIAMGLGMIASAAVGAAAVESLHAQAKPPAYLIGAIDVSNAEAYGKEFAPKAQITIKAGGGRFVAIGGSGGALASGQVTALDGEAPKRAVIIAWDSVEKAKAWYNSPEYQELLKTGQKYAKFNTFVIEGLPQ
jgi:uncharacterized protein (DUF1330 family)